MARWIGSILKGNGFTRQAKQAFDIQAEVRYCHPEYDFKPYAMCETRGSRPLIVASLDPRDTSLPSFSLRWDPHGNHLDVDIEKVNRKVKKLFKREKNGYLGHRPKTVAEKLFDVNIRIPTQDIFMGKIGFKIHENVITSENVSIGEKETGILKKDGQSRTIK